MLRLGRTSLSLSEGRGWAAITARYFIPAYNVGGLRSISSSTGGMPAYQRALNHSQSLGAVQVKVNLRGDFSSPIRRRRLLKKRLPDAGSMMPMIAPGFPARLVSADLAYWCR